MRIQIKKNQEYFGELRWIARALNTDKDNPIPFINHVFKNDNYFVATDESRLHFFRLTDHARLDGFHMADITDGLYKMTKNNKGLIELTLAYEKGVCRYPDVCKDVVQWTVPHNSIELVYNSKSGSSKAFATIIRGSEIINIGGSTINYCFLNDILNCGEVFNVWQEGPDKPINFKNDNKFAALMPIIERERVS